MAGANRQDGEELFADTGYTLTRWFLWILLSAFAVFGVVATALAWHFRMDVSVKGGGLLACAMRQQVKPRVSGIIGEIHAEHGSLVREGDRLVTLDDREWRNALDKVDGEIAIVRSRADRLKARLASERSIAEDELQVAAIEAERAALEVRRIRLEHSVGQEAVGALLGWRRPPLDDLVPVRRAQAVLEQKQALAHLARSRRSAHDGRALEVAELHLEQKKLTQERQRLAGKLVETVLRSPIDGTVLTAELKERRGDRVEVGETVVEVGNADSWVIETGIDETGIARVRVGHDARIEITAFPHMEYDMLHGKVARIGVRATPSGYPVKIALARTVDGGLEPSLQLFEGMTATVRIVVDRGRVLELLWREALRGLGRINPDALRLPAAGDAA